MMKISKYRLGDTLYLGRIDVPKPVIVVRKTQASLTVIEVESCRMIVVTDEDIDLFDNEVDADRFRAEELEDAMQDEIALHREKIRHLESIKSTINSKLGKREIEK